MTTEMITFKLENNFLKEVDAAVKTQCFQSRTEFIRTALREKVEEARLKDALLQLSNLKGISNKKTSVNSRESSNKLFRFIVF